MKWSLAKMRPNVYCDQARIHLGSDAEAPPIQTANVELDLSVYTEEEKATLRALSRKALMGRHVKLDAAIPQNAERLEGR